MQNMKILLLHFTKRQEVSRKTFKKAFAKFGLEPEIQSFNALDEFPEMSLIEKYERIIFTGSEFSFEGLNEPEEVRQKAIELGKSYKEFIFHLVDSSTPSLAICFGHQLFGFAYGQTVAHNKCLFKAGAFKVLINSKEAKEDPLLKGLPEEFLAAYMHQDVVFGKSEEARVLASGEKCNFAILKYGQNSYTTQFHPEFDKEVLHERYRTYPNYFKKQDSWSEDLLKDTPEANKILKNFVLNF